jgi:hypothetical protein
VRWFLLSSQVMRKNQETSAVKNKGRQRVSLILAFLPAVSCSSPASAFRHQGSVRYLWSRTWQALPCYAGHTFSWLILSFISPLPLSLSHFPRHPFHSQPSPLLSSPFLHYFLFLIHRLHCYKAYVIFCYPDQVPLTHFIHRATKVFGMWA